MGKRKVAPATSTAPMRPLADEFSLLKRLHGDKAAVNAEFHEEEGAAIARLRARIEAGESLGDPVTDYLVRKGYWSKTKLKDELQALLAQVNGHRGELILAVTEYATFGKAGGMSGGSHDSVNTIHFGKISDAPFRVAEDTRDFSPLMVELPVAPLVTETQTRGIGWAQNDEDFSIGKGPLQLNHASDGLLHKYFGRSDGGFRWLGMPSLDDRSATRSVTLELYIGDAEVVKYFQHDEDSLADEPSSSRRWYATQLLRLAYSVEDPLERTPDLRRLAQIARAEVCRDFGRTIELWQERKKPEDRRSYQRTVERELAWGERYKLADRDPFPRARRLLAAEPKVEAKKG